MQGRSGVLSLSDSGSWGRTARTDGAHAFCAGKVDVFDIVTVRGAAVLAAAGPHPPEVWPCASRLCGARCCVAQGPVGKLSRVRVGHDGSGFSPSWSPSPPRSQHCIDLGGPRARRSNACRSALSRFAVPLPQVCGGTVRQKRGRDDCAFRGMPVVCGELRRRKGMAHYPILLADPSAAATVPVLPATEPIHESDPAWQPHRCIAQYEASQALRACVRGRSSYAISSRCTLARQQKMKSRTL